MTLFNHPHYGNGHYYCQSCGHLVRAGAWGCGSCSTPLAELMLFDDFALGGGFGGGDIGFDPLDGQLTVGLGNGLAYEPGTGDIDVETSFGDFPI